MTQLRSSSVRRGVTRLRTSGGWRFLALLPRTSRPLATGWWSLVVLAGALPAGFTLATGALVAAVQQGDGIVGPLVLAGGLFMAMNVSAPLLDALSSDLGGRVGGMLRERLLVACTAPSGIAHLETPDLADDLAKAR